MNPKYIRLIAAITFVGVIASQAETVFTDTFDYTNGAFIDEGGWTTEINTGLGLGSESTTGILWGNPGDGESGLEFEHPTALVAGEMITMNANVDRGGGYSYGMRIILWDGADAGTRQEVAGGTIPGVGPTTGANYDLPAVEYAVTSANIGADLTHVIFKYTNDGNWSETHDVTFAVDPAPTGWTWINASGGSWATVNDWTPDGPANLADETALINSLDITGDQAITLDGNYTIGTLRFADIAGDDGNWILDTGTGSPLTLSAPEDGSPGIVVSNQTATMNAVLAGTEGLTKTGAGTLVLGAANTYTGGTFIDAGTLQVGDAAAIPSGAGNGDVALGGTLDLNDNSITVNALTGNGTVTNSGTATPTLTIGGDDADGLAFAGTIEDGSGITSLAKTGTGTLTLTGTHTFSGSVAGNGGSLVLGGGFNRLHNVASISVDPGATVELNGGNMFVGGHGEALDDTRVLTVDAGILFMNTDMESRIGNVALSNGATWTIDRGLDAWDVLLANTTAGAATVSLANTGDANDPAFLNGAGGLHLQGVQNFDIGDVTGDTAADLEVSLSLVDVGNAGGEAGGVNKLGIGTMLLTAQNSYRGDTIITAGAVTLADSGELRLVIGENGINNKVTGAGTATLDGAFNLDLTAANSANGNSWTLVDVATRSFGATFSVLGFTETLDIHTLVDGGATWTFTEATGVLSVTSAVSDYNTWATSNTYWTPGAANSGPGEDFDNDGQTNQEEYAFGLNPTDGTSVTPITSVDRSSGTFSYTRRNPALTGLSYTYEWSTDLSNWTAVTPAVADGVVASGDNQTVTVDLTDAPGDPLAIVDLFLRVKID